MCNVWQTTYVLCSFVFACHRKFYVICSYDSLKMNYIAWEGTVRQWSANYIRFYAFYAFTDLEPVPNLVGTGVCLF